ncbi:MAG: HAD family hydrolase [Ruminococcus sp.]|nr:HAD family hydrolase [Ruminococcus sp.]
MYQHILFDLDGTVTDSAEGILATARYTLAQFDILSPAEEQLRRFIGPPLQDSFREIFGFSEVESRRAVEIYRSRYRTDGMFRGQVYAGIPQLLEQLCAMGRTLHIATCKPEPFAVQILEHLGLARYFAYITGAALDDSRRTKGEVIGCALERIGAPPKRDVVMIGDREHDVLGAKEHHVDCIGVLYGYGTREELEQAGASAIAATPADCIPLV